MMENLNAFLVIHNDNKKASNVKVDQHFNVSLFFEKPKLFYQFFYHTYLHTESFDLVQRENNSIKPEIKIRRCFRT